VSEPDTGVSTNIEDQLSDLLDDSAFREIDGRFRRFNFFEAVGAVRNELRHSNFLAYLLSPARPHSLGTDILERLLRALLSKLPQSSRPIGILDIITGDLDTAIIERERDYIDILIEIRALNFVVLIENKVGATVTENQLSGYKATIQNKYKGWRQLFVLLNPDGSRPQDYDDEQYLIFSYYELAEILSKYLNERRHSLSSEITLILGNYVDALRRYVVVDTKLQEKARLLYSKHKEAFDFIFTNLPQPDDMLEPLNALIKANPNLAPDNPSPRRVRFAPKEWKKYKSLNSCSPAKWTKSERSLLFEIQAHRASPRINVNLILGPGPEAFRQFVFSEASKNPSIFIGMTKPLGRETSTIYVRDLLSEGATQNLDEVEKLAELKQRGFVSRMRTLKP
jgi:hypothetical protein